MLHRLPRPPAPRRGRRRPPDDYFTEENVDRYLAAAAERGDRGARRLRARPPLHRRRSSIWEHPFWQRTGADDLDAYCEFVARHAAATRDRDGLRPRARGSDRQSARGPRLRLRGRLGPLPRRAAPSTTTASTSGRRDGDPDARLAPLLRDARRGGPDRALRHPRPPRPGQDLGARPAAARARPAPLLRARGRGDRREPASRSRSRPPACASRSASSIRPRVRRDVRRGGGGVRALLRRPRRPSRSATATTARSSSCDDLGVERDLPSSRRRERRLEPLGADAVERRG